MNLWLIFIGISGAMGVAAGAWAAHGLASDPVAQAWGDTASRYQLIHAAVLLGLSLADRHDDGAAVRVLHAARWLFAAGMILFCGALYALAVGASPPFPGMAPTGGMAIIAGWLCIAVYGGLTVVRRPE